MENCAYLRKNPGYAPEMVCKPVKLTIGEEGRIFMVQEKLTTHFMIFVHWKTCSEHFFLGDNSIESQMP